MSRSANAAAQKFVNECEAIKKVAPVVGMAVGGNADDAMEWMAALDIDQMMQLHAALALGEGAIHFIHDAFHKEMTRRVVTGECTREEVLEKMDESMGVDEDTDEPPYAG